MWFHTKNIPGSHTVVLSEGREIPEAPCIRQPFWQQPTPKAADSAQVPVDYTLIKMSKSRAIAKPGMVIYVSYQTAYVTPDLELEKRLLVE